jgi:hypothetical protein
VVQGLQIGGASLVPRQETFLASAGSPVVPKIHRKQHTALKFFLGNDAASDELDRLAGRLTPACTSAKEQSMRKHLLAIATVMAAMSAPIAAQAQNTVGVAGPVMIDDGAVGITTDQRPAFREYIVRERVPNYTIPDRVVVGGVLPEAGVTYYDVPQSFGATTYRYTVVNGETVLVEPRTRRIVQVIE